MFAVKASRWLPPLLLTSPLVPVRVLFPRAILRAALVRPQALNTNARGAAISTVTQKQVDRRTFVLGRHNLDILNVKAMTFQILDLFGTP